MSNEIFFSVIIPTYNREKLLIRALESLKIQTYKKFEVIVVDDGSTDNTEISCVAFKNSFSSFKYFKIDNSGGPAKPRNIGIENSVGEWICFLDSDDYWFPNKLEICKNNINFDNDVLYHNLKISGFRSKIRGKNLGENPFKALIKNGNRIPLSASLVRKEVIQKIRFEETNNLSSIEDYHFWLMISCVTKKFKYLNISLGYYHVDVNIRITQFNQKSALKYLFLKELLLKDNLINKRQSGIFNYSIALNLYFSNQNKRANVFFKNVFLFHPKISIKLKALAYYILPK